MPEPRPEPAPAAPAAPEAGKAATPSTTPLGPRPVRSLKRRPKRRSFWDPVAIWAAISAAIGAGGLVVTKAIDEPTEAVCQAAANALGDETPNPYLTPAQNRAYIEANLNTVRECQRKIIDD